MQLRTLIFLALAGFAAWRWHGGLRQLPPPGVAVAGKPFHQFAPTGQSLPIGDTEFSATPYTYSHVRGRVLGTKRYRDSAADVAPYDFVLGWERMSDPAVYAPLNINQSGRRYSYSLPPGSLARDEIDAQSGAYHLIPANDDVAGTLKEVALDDIVVMDGQYVEVSGTEGSGGLRPLPNASANRAACGMFRVTRVVIEPRAAP